MRLRELDHRVLEYLIPNYRVVIDVAEALKASPREIYNSIDLLESAGLLLRDTSAKDLRFMTSGDGLIWLRGYRRV